MAEVSDKVPTLGDLWIWVAALTILAFFAGVWRWWAAVLVALFSVLSARGMASELQSFDVGPAIVKELGPAYVNAAWVAVGAQVALPAVAGLVGWLLHRALQKRRRGSALAINASRG